MRRAFEGSRVYAVLCVCASVACSQTTDTGSAGMRVWPMGELLAGAKYDIADSKFAFGSKPVREAAGDLTRWVGSHGVVAIAADGAVMAILNAGAPEANRSAWSPDSDKLTVHVTDYFAGFRIDASQIKDATPFGRLACSGPTQGGSQSCVAMPSSVNLSRGIDGI